MNRPVDLPIARADVPREFLPIGDDFPEQPRHVITFCSCRGGVCECTVRDGRNSDGERCRAHLQDGL